MDNDFNFCDNAPEYFGFCLKTDCASAGECLRAFAARDLTPVRSTFTLVNPLLADTAGARSCRFFRKAEKVRMAYGFRRAFALIPAGNVKVVRSEVCELVCRRNYYYLLRGQKPLSPAMQKKIAAILKRHGLTVPMEFDRYEWQYVW
ncbi:DUF6078 family protein [uncultured Bacteroides sp.]|uniref:DUF6078 family protein n=1 Tax=uncultured Bacteroides sp. TaxID=162156 RepID=UPI002623E6E9|nr:DUF6078 family protein [uncultured Bacteroides sp.]